ncbi:MAG: hypothetical protein WAV47_07155 [Blastocatellia bacterium]
MIKGWFNSPVFACVFVLLSLGASVGSDVKAQSPECRTIDESADYTVRSVKVEGRWTPSLTRLELKDLVGKKYSPPLVSRAQERVSSYLEKDENKTIERKVLGMYSVLYVRSCVVADDNAKTVDIIIKPIYARVDLYRVGSNVLPVSRSLLPTFYDTVPAPLLAFNPEFGADYDRENGLSPSLSISTNLLDLPKLVKTKAVSKSAFRLDLKAWGRKSADNPFYNAGVDLSVSRRREGNVLEVLAIDGYFQAGEQPLSEARYLQNAARLGGSVRIHPDSMTFNRISLSGKYRWANNRLVNNDESQSLRTTEQAFEARAIVDGRVAGGFSRLAVWVDAASPTKRSGSYGRLAGVYGLEKEFGSKNQTVGVEALAGGGRAWGAVPEYARFFGGNSARNFLYEAQDSPAMSDFPVGPLIRSFGQAQARAKIGTASARGGTSYWHFNLNVNIPLSALSRSLIPNVPIQNDDGSTILLKDKLKGFAIGSAVGGIADTMIDQIIKDLMNQGMSEAEATQKAAEIAQKRAEKIVGKEIKPAIEFIADKANLYALKPLLMFDAARINARGSLDNRTRFAAGGGLQFTVVIARFEAGYLKTIRRMEGDPRGNFIMRLVFQNLF